MRIWIIALSLATVACTSAGPAAVSPCEPQGMVSIGESLPDCSFAGVGDEPLLDLIELHGKPHVLNFWASWCTACVKEMPDFQQIWEELGHRFEMVGMNTLNVDGETKESAVRFATSTGVRYRLAYDTDGLLYSHFRPAESPVLPLTVFADADGVVRHTNFGQISQEQLLALLAEHLDVS